LPWAVKKAQVCFYLSDKTSSILCTRRASFFSAANLDFIRKNAVLTDQVLPIQRVAIGNALDRLFHARLSVKS